MNSLNGGVLRGKFHREWAFGGKWILDFFFWEERIGIEVDGRYHRTPHQQKRDKLKDNACLKHGIVLTRVTNEEVFGDRVALVEKLRSGWRKIKPLKKMGGGTDNE